METTVISNNFTITVQRNNKTKRKVMIKKSQTSALLQRKIPATCRHESKISIYINYSRSLLQE